jgi:hypothetical protein
MHNSIFARLQRDQWRRHWRARPVAPNYRATLLTFYLIQPGYCPSNSEKSLPGCSNPVLKSIEGSDPTSLTLPFLLFGTVTTKEVFG